MNCISAIRARVPGIGASFGFVNQFGFLTLPLLTDAVAPLSPAAAGLPALASFDNGDVLARDDWAGRTILALRTGGAAPLACSGHLHGDVNSFILAHNANASSSMAGTVATAV